SRFRWRVDDADTRFDTTNRGLPNKEYSVETHDTDETGASIWNGETNNFFNLMELAFPEEKVASMRGMMTAMQSLGGLKSGNDLEKIYAFYQKYFFDEAQEYFPANSYNADARYCYENGKLAYRAGIYSNDTDPITQSLGDHYQAEQRWITKRILYMMSKYSFGLFSAAGTDTITVRAAGNTITYDLTPAMDMYPAIANGTSIIRGERTRAGETCSMVIELSGTGDQQNAIQGASYLQDIGDWYDKNVQGSMVIQGRMLREIRLGSKTGHIVISITSLTISNCTSLQKLVLSNIATLSGTLNLTSCTHLQEVYADGTSLSQMKLPTGGSMRVIEFSPRNQYLSLSNYPLLPTEGVRMDQCKHIITDFFVEDCPLLHPVKLLVEVMEAQKEQGTEHALKRVRVVGFNETYDSSDILDKLAILVDGSYEGLSSEGIAGEDPVPVLDGTLNIHADVYEESINALRSKFNRLVLNITGNYYVRFKDPEFQRLVVERWSTDGVGVTQVRLDALKEFQDENLQGNAMIEDLSDFGEKFRNVDIILGRTFENCTRLKKFGLPVYGMSMKNNTTFCNTSLDEYGIDLSRITVLGYQTFKKCKFVDVFIPNTISLVLAGSSWAENSLLVKMELEEGITEIPDGICASSPLLENIIIPSTVTKIGRGPFHSCNSLKKIVCKAINPPTFVDNFGYISSNKFFIYVPDESVDIYKKEWSQYVSKLKPISELE
ncbi:MAG TPA: cell surface protein, partial [Butyricimonas sp.]